jgi:Rieske Fe-S protein
VESVDRKLCPCGTPSRRDLLAATSALGLTAAIEITGTPAAAEPTDERPQEGDQFVAIDAATSMALEPKDVAAPQVIAWPLDPASGVVRNGSRLNKVLLVRLDPATLTGATKDRAADGVVAYSAICPHAGCEVSGWVEDQKILECPCHNSRYDPRAGGSIVDGPTTRGLAALPLKLVHGKLTVAKPFIGRVGIAPA